MLIIEPITPADICANFRDLAPIMLVLLALVLPVTDKQLRPLERVFSQLAKRKKLALFLVFLLAFVGCAMVSWLFYFPIPTAHDEFGYLLTADTFAHGRLTNPTHPMWVHFESFHILQQPTYNSKYFPAQGVLLALGQVIGGHPVVGVWLGMALACCAVCWMLQGWLPPKWAFLGGLLMILKLGLFSYWSHSYWSGAAATIGGALVFGGLRRIAKKATAANAVCFSLGLGILANSRPYEGLCTSLPAIGFLVFWLFSRNKVSFATKVKHIILPTSLVLLAALSFIAYYNFVVTGNPLFLPYRAYETTYGKLPHFFWEPPPAEVKYNHPVMRTFYRGWFFNFYKAQVVSFSVYLKGFLEKLTSMWEFYIHQSFTLPLLVLPFLLKNRWMILAIVSLLTLLFGMMLAVFSYGHFAAPGVGLLYLLVLQCLRRIYVWRWQNKPSGKLIVWSLPIYCLLLIFLPISLGESPYFFVNANPWEPMRMLDSNWSFKRQAFISQLSKEEGNHLVIVSYLPGHNAHEEWVYNGADIDNSKIIWARAMTVDKDCELIKYFKDRKIWFIEVGNSPNIELKPYPVDLCSSN